MSRLTINSNSGESFIMNVRQFRSPMSADIQSAQTRDMLQHFPIRAGQPDIQFTVQFVSVDEKTKFEAFVRRHQMAARDEQYGFITLNWPERSIVDWTGYINEYTVSVRRFDYAPIVTFGVSLMDSMMGELDFTHSIAASFNNVLGPQIINVFQTVDGMLRDPAQGLAPYFDYWERRR